MIGNVSGTINGEGRLLAVSLLLGMGLMIFYDSFRILRKCIAHSVWVTAIEDAVYWLLCAAAVFSMLYNENDGLLRWFVLAGLAIGMLFWNYAVSSWLVRLTEKILKKIFGVLRKPAVKISKKGRKIFLFFQKQLKKIKKVIKISVKKL